MAIHLDFTRNITVLREDIDNGVQRSCQNCPIALALRREFPDAEYIEVNSAYIVVDNKKCSTPEEAQEFIEKFDWSTDTRFINEQTLTLTFTW